MSLRSEERSGEEDWRAAAEAKTERASFFTRWFIMLTVLGVVALVNLAWWLASR
jgi:hypothetical protein